MASRTRHDRERGLIRLTVLGILEHRDVVLRAVSAACKLVTANPRGPRWNEFQQQVVSAVSEAFNNLVLHGYRGKSNGRVDLVIKTGADSIQIELRDWGKSFDPQAVPIPELETLPESGMGIFIMRSFMEVGYRKGRPNLLTLSKTLETSEPEPALG